VSRLAQETSSVKECALDQAREAGAALARRHPLTEEQARSVERAVRDAGRIDAEEDL
jgi:hypothetical protein